MRGGRGGRGRGRFGSGGRTVTQDLIRDNMEDLGFDSFQVIDDRIPPPLYPPTNIPVPSPLTEEETFAVQKMRELVHRVQLSPYYLTGKIEQVDDIKRYSDKYRKASAAVTLADCIDTTSEDASRFIPQELIDGRGMRSTSDSDAKKRRDEQALQRLEQAEAGGGVRTEKKAEEGSDAEGDELEEADEFEMDDDYGVDHYASDDGGGDDDNMEATF